MRRHEHRDAQLAVGPPEQGREGRLPHGVEHRRGLVEQQQPRTHGQDGGEGEHLQLTSRELRAAGVEPRPHAQEVARLRHATAHLRLGDAEVLEAERQLPQNSIADELGLGVLGHVPHERDAKARVVGEGRRGHALDLELPHDPAHRGHLGLGEAQEGGLAATRCPNEHGEVSLVELEGDVPQHGGQAGALAGGIGIGEADVAHAQGLGHQRDLQDTLSARTARLGSRTCSTKGR